MIWRAVGYIRHGLQVWKQMSEEQEKVYYQICIWRRYWPTRRQQLRYWPRAIQHGPEVQHSMTSRGYGEKLRLMNDERLGALPNRFSHLPYTS